MYGFNLRDMLEAVYENGVSPLGERGATPEDAHRMLASAIEMELAKLEECIYSNEPQVVIEGFNTFKSFIRSLLGEE